MRVIVGCEFSGKVRDSFAKIGWDAWSCDVLPSTAPGNHHQGDILEFLEKTRGTWDLGIFHPPCFIAGTLITTQRGLIPIEDVRVTDMVLTHTGNWKKVYRTSSDLVPHTITIKNSLSHDITTTPEHPFLTRLRWANNSDGNKIYNDKPVWLEASKLTNKTFIGTILPPTQKFQIDDETLWLMGRYVADGWLRPSRWTEGKYESMTIAIGKGKEEYFNRSVKRKYKVTSERTCKRATFYGHDKIVPFEEFGKGAKNKRLPMWVLCLPKEQATIFLDGYLSGDGHDTGTSISAETVSYELSYGISTLMRRVYEVPVSITQLKVKPTTVIEGRTVNQLPRYKVYCTHYPKTNRQCNYIDGCRTWGRISELTNDQKLTQVYNLSVEDDESYLANGIMVHNCTYLANSGVQHLHKEHGRHACMLHGAWFFRQLLNADIPHIAVENPIPHGYAVKEIGSKYTQIIHPYQFGHKEKKATCLWLRNLPKLVPTTDLKAETDALPMKEQQRMFYLSGKDRGLKRSVTYQGFADSFAVQWGSFITQTNGETQCL